MHIKDIETRTGLSRANIRYYEQEGLVHPVRARNGYRDYSQEDLDTLLRVRLLRRLDVPIEEIRAMQAGELDLADVLEERIRAAQRREEQARRDQAVCRAMQADRVRYDSLDPEKYWLALHTAAQAAPAAPQADRQEPCPWRRFLARNLDLALCAGNAGRAHIVPPAGVLPAQHHRRTAADAGGGAGAAAPVGDHAGKAAAGSDGGKARRAAAGVG